MSQRRRRCLRLWISGRSAGHLHERARAKLLVTADKSQEIAISKLARAASYFLRLDLGNLGSLSLLILVLVVVVVVARLVNALITMLTLNRIGKDVCVAFSSRLCAFANGKFLL